jgi:hypothetical protein
MFVPQISSATDDPEAVLALWAADAITKGTVVRTDIGVDAENPGRHVWSVQFDSAESAQQNSDRPETAAFSERFSALCTEGPTFQNLDVVRSWPN